MCRNQCRKRCEYEKPGCAFSQSSRFPGCVTRIIILPFRGPQALHKLTEALIENVRVMKTTPPIAIIATEYNDLHAEIATYLAGAVLPRLILQNLAVQRFMLLVVILFQLVDLKQNIERCFKIQHSPVICSYSFK